MELITITNYNSQKSKHALNCSGLASIKEHFPDYLLKEGYVKDPSPGVLLKKMRKKPSLERKSLSKFMTVICFIVKTADI